MAYLCEGVETHVADLVTDAQGSASVFEAAPRIFLRIRVPDPPVDAPEGRCDRSLVPDRADDLAEPLHQVDHLVGRRDPPEEVEHRYPGRGSEAQRVHRVRGRYDVSKRLQRLQEVIDPAAPQGAQDLRARSP